MVTATKIRKAEPLELRFGAVVVTHTLFFPEDGSVQQTQRDNAKPKANEQKRGYIDRVCNFLDYVSGAGKWRQDIARVMNDFGYSMG